MMYPHGVLVVPFLCLVRCIPPALFSFRIHTYVAATTAVAQQGATVACTVLQLHSVAVKKKRKTVRDLLDRVWAPQ